MKVKKERLTARGADGDRGNSKKRKKKFETLIKFQEYKKNNKKKQTKKKEISKQTKKTPQNGDRWERKE